MMKRTVIFLSFFITAVAAFCQTTPADSVQWLQWSDSVLQTLSTREKIAQLLCVRVPAGEDETAMKAIDQLIEQEKIGGLCFFKGTTERQITLTNRWQTQSEVPLFITIDGETGVGMRLTDIEKFPAAITLGAITDDSLIYRIGAEIGRQCRTLGIQIDFAPVADVNTNPQNPVIGTRSFGEDRDNVARKAIAYIQGMQSQRIIAVAKHFPGHGDTHTDSHKLLPYLPHRRQRLDSIELYPFRQIIAHGVDGIMVAHLNIPALDSNRLASSISQPIVTQLLKQELGFQGLVITDGLEMNGITFSTEEGETELKAFLAGNDMLLLPRNPLKALNTIEEAVNKKQISLEEIDQRCRKILYHKIKNGINAYNYINKENAVNQLNSETAQQLSRTAFEQAGTVVTNHNVLPLNLRHASQSAIVCYGEDHSGFQTAMKRFGLFRQVDYSSSLTAEHFANDSVVIAAVFSGSSKSGKFGIAEAHVKQIQQLAKEKKVVLCLFASPYALSLFEGVTLHGCIVGYENRKYAGDAIAQIICGVKPASGKLPVSAGDFKVGDGINITLEKQLTMASPQSLEINEKYLKIIDSLAQMGIDQKAYPGCQILVAKDGKVFYHKAFGYLTYDQKDPVTTSHLYDVASLTKILATTPSIMLLDEQEKMDIDQTLGHYLSFLSGTNKEKMVIREVLAHQGGLKSWIPFYKNIENDSITREYLYSTTPDSAHNVLVAHQMYMRPEFQDTLYQLIARSELLPKKKYLYSDLGMILFKKIIEQVSNKTLQQFVNEQFYAKMKLGKIDYLPLERFPQEMIAPTELDDDWRKQQIQGYVHDMAAAMLGGVSGHAGIFSNAWDVACMMQMYLQGGVWGEQQILQPSTIQEFTSVQFPLERNRRGLGFDKPLDHYHPNGPTCQEVSRKSFGHNGFTGCYAWADPENGLVYVFLSNRIYPTSNNSKISNLDIRTKIHQAAYQAVKE